MSNAVNIKAFEETLLKESNILLEIFANEKEVIDKLKEYPKIYSLINDRKKLSEYLDKVVYKKEITNLINNYIAYSLKSKFDIDSNEISNDEYKTVYDSVVQYLDPGVCVSTFVHFYDYINKTKKFI